MSFKKLLGTALVILGSISMVVPFTREFMLVSVILVVLGIATIIRGSGIGSRLRHLFDAQRRPIQPQVKPQPRIDPLLPVRVLKLAESRSGVITVSSVAIALNVGLDECQLALDELVRKGAATVDVDLSNGVASYSFPEFLPRMQDGAGSR